MISRDLNNVILRATATLKLFKDEFISVEHLLLALGAENGRPVASYMPMPHPSGLAVDRERGVVHVASTRNPNQVYDLAPVTGLMERLDLPAGQLHERPLVPMRSRFSSRMARERS